MPIVKKLVIDGVEYDLGGGSASVEGTTLVLDGETSSNETENTSNRKRVIYSTVTKQDYQPNIIANADDEVITIEFDNTLNNRYFEFDVGYYLNYSSFDYKDAYYGRLDFKINSDVSNCRIVMYGSHTFSEISVYYVKTPHFIFHNFQSANQLTADGATCYHKESGNYLGENMFGVYEPSSASANSLIQIFFIIDIDECGVVTWNIANNYEL